MKYIFTFVWSFVLVAMLNYVVSSINNVPFDFDLGAILSLVVSLVILLITAILPNDPVAHESH